LVTIAPAATTPPRAISALAEAELVAEALSGSEGAVREIIRRNNQRLFRTARAIVRSDSEAEDVVQAGYVQAFTHLQGFRGESRLATWLTRIVLNEAFARGRRFVAATGLEAVESEQQTGAQIIQFPMLHDDPDPETAMSLTETRDVLEAAIDALPEAFRSVFVLREVEGLSTEETATNLGLKPSTVNTRLFRARKLLRNAIERELALPFSALFPFGGTRCAAMAERVVLSLAIRSAEPAGRAVSHS
jgi:RNA polymerase sigma-70 factor (ECF subfamily)